MIHPPPPDARGVGRRAAVAPPRRCPILKDASPRSSSGLVAQRRPLPHALNRSCAAHHRDLLRSILISDNHESGTCHTPHYCNMPTCDVQLDCMEAGSWPGHTTRAGTDTTPRIHPCCESSLYVPRKRATSGRRRAWPRAMATRGSFARGTHMHWHAGDVEGMMPVAGAGGIVRRKLRPRRAPPPRGALTTREWRAQSRSLPGS